MVRWCLAFRLKIEPSTEARDYYAIPRYLAAFINHTHPLAGLIV